MRKILLIALLLAPLAAAAQTPAPSPSMQALGTDWQAFEAMRAHVLADMNSLIAELQAAQDEAKKLKAENEALKKPADPKP